MNSTLSGRSSEDNTAMDCYQCRSDLNGSCAEEKPSAAYLTPCPSFENTDTVELMDNTVKSKDVWCRKIIQNTAFVNDTPTITYIRECTAFHKSAQQCYYEVTQLFSITVCECNDKMGCNVASDLNENTQLLGFMVNLIVVVYFLMK
nr:uncharacterized protein LOC111420643 [Onthophagus taurus]XP_022910007.1 uncharacterized protein LOC111421104 [Onthophagus taurus]